MKILLLIISGSLFLAIIDLPIGYYTFLRILVTIGASSVILTEISKGINFWIIIFGIIAILFNPIIPVYLNDKSVWIPIDIIAAIFFLIKSITLNIKKYE